MYVQLRNAVDSGAFGQFMNFVLFLNLFFVVYESLCDLNGWPPLAVTGYVELVFSLVYVVEVAANLLVVSWAEYKSHTANIFDFVTTWLLLASSILDEMLVSTSSGSIKQYMNILRLLRLLRVIKQLKSSPTVRFMANAVITLLWKSKDILSLLGIVAFFFTGLSVQLWGGLLYENNPKLSETEFKEKNFYALNFNDFLMASAVWVVSFLLEYVPAFAEAVARVSSAPWTWWVFPIFYVCGVSIVFELVKAFTIEVFVDLNRENNKEKAEGSGEHEDNRSDSSEKEKDTSPLSRLMEHYRKMGLQLHYREVGDAALSKKISEAWEEKMEESYEIRKGSKC